MSERCQGCGYQLPPLCGIEENDFAILCDDCDDDWSDEECVDCP